MKRQVWAPVALAATFLFAWTPLDAFADCDDPGPPSEHLDFYLSYEQPVRLCNNVNQSYEANRVIAACTALLRDGCTPSAGSRLYSDDQKTYVMSIYASRARAYSAVGRVEEAIADLDAALQLRPGEPRLLNSRCWERATHNRGLDLALADCNAALQRRPNEPNILDSRGLVHLQRGAFDAAFADYDAAVRAVPQFASALYGRGIAQVRLGQLAAGESDMQAATARDSAVAEHFMRYGVRP